MELVSGGELFDQIVKNKSFNEVEAADQKLGLLKKQVEEKQRE